MKKIIISFAIGIVLGSIVTMITYSIYYGSIKQNSSYGLLEWTYYLTQPLGVISTIMAVVVALFGKEIRSLFFQERCEVSLVNSGFYENLGRYDNSPNPIALSHDCFVKITNTGGKIIEGCELVLKEVNYKAQGGSYKRIFSAEHKALYWETPEIKSIDLSLGDSRTLSLFRIYPESSCETPDKSMSSPLRMRIIGCNVDSKFTSKGCWNGRYEVRCKAKILCIFEVSVEWNGVWCNRSTEMDDQVSASLNIF